MLIRDLTMSEADYFEVACNFVRDEGVLFNLLREGKTLEECAEIMNMSVSNVKRISQKVKAKIKKEI